MQHTILGLRTIIYKVSDLQKAKEWYQNAFGVDPYFDEPFYIGFTVGGYELGLQQDDASKGENVVTYWGVSDINSAYNFFVESGATSFEPPRNVGGEIMVATVKDPWNNVVGLIYNSEFSL